MTFSDYLFYSTNSPKPKDIPLAQDSVQKYPKNHCGRAYSIDSSLKLSNLQSAGCKVTFVFSMSPPRSQHLGALCAFIDLSGNLGDRWPLGIMVTSQACGVLTL